MVLLNYVSFYNTSHFTYQYLKYIIKVASYIYKSFKLNNKYSRYLLLYLLNDIYIYL